MQHRVAGVLMVACGLTGAASAQQFHIGSSEVSQNGGGGITDSVYFGPNFGNGDRRGAVLDGGSDAYDDAGYYTNAFAPGVVVSRRTNTLADINVFRWIDTYTNTGAAPLLVTMLFESNLGSDSLTVIETEERFRSVTYEDRQPSSTDPVLGMMHGNNDFSSEFIHPDLSRPGFLTRRISMTLLPNEPVTLMFADFLVRDLTNRGRDREIAMLGTADFLDQPTPLMSGLSDVEIGAIRNWTIPAPGAGVGLMAGLLWGVRRRRG